MDIELMKAQRKARNLSQRDVAKAVHRNRATVAHWEAGDSVPDTQILPALATVLGVTVDALLGRTGHCHICGKPATGFIRTADGLVEFCSKHAADSPTDREAS